MAKGRVTDTTGDAAVAAADRQRSRPRRSSHIKQETRGSGNYSPSSDPRNQAIEKGNGSWKWAGVTATPRNDHGQSHNQLSKNLRRIEKKLEGRWINPPKDNQGFTKPGSRNPRKH